MANPLGTDDWIVPEQSSAGSVAPSRVTAGDDWIVPDEPPSAAQRLEHARTALKPAPMQRVEDAITRGEVEGFGSEPIGLSPESEAALQKTGLLHTPGQPFRVASSSHRLCHSPRRRGRG